MHHWLYLKRKSTDDVNKCALYYVHLRECCRYNKDDLSIAITCTGAENKR